jgi:hypothetical protein
MKKTAYGKKITKKLSKETIEKLKNLGLDPETSVAPKRMVF